MKPHLILAALAALGACSSEANLSANVALIDENEARAEATAAPADPAAAASLGRSGAGGEAEGLPDGETARAAACIVHLQAEQRTAPADDSLAMDRDQARWRRELVRRAGGRAPADRLLASASATLSQAPAVQRQRAVGYCRTYAPR